MVGRAHLDDRRLGVARRPAFEIYRLTGSTLATAAYFLAGLIPQVLFGSAAGVFVDRWDRRRLMIWINIALAVALLPLLAVDTAGVWIVYATVVVAVILSLLFIPAEVAVLPQLVEADDLVAANSLSSLNRNLSRLIGPAMGGVAVAISGLAGVVVIDALSFVAAAVLIALIPARAAFKPALLAHADGQLDGAPSGSALGRVFAELRDGIAQARASSLLMAMLFFSLITAVGEGVLGALFVPWSTDILHGDDLVFAALLSTQAIGGLVGAFIVGRYLRAASPARMLGVGAVLFGLIDLVLFTYPVVAPVVWPALIGMVIVGIPATAMQVGGTTIQQTEVADSHRGRIVGLWMTTIAIGAIVGTTVAGVFGEVIGILPLVVIQGSGYLISGLMVLYVVRRIGAQAPPAEIQVEAAAGLLTDQSAIATDAALASER